MSSSKRHFTVVIGNKEHGLYVSFTPSSAARKAVSKLCADNKKKKVEFSIRETTQGSNKKVYGPYIGYMQKLDNPIELEGRVIQYKPIAKLKKKNRKMKGGVEILGQGFEGIVLRPNINNILNDSKVSKLITATPEEVSKLIAFEDDLNRIDGDGIYHVKMLSSRNITQENINAISNVNQSKKNDMIYYNFKITYQYGGISIEYFLKNFEKYSKLVTPHFIKKLLRGILNCFIGLYVFYKSGIVHSDLNEGNIVFFLEDPEIMRLIDWGNLLERNTYVTHYLYELRFPSLDKKKIVESLNNFYIIIRKLLDKIKVVGSIPEKLLTKFLEIPNFKIYELLYTTAKILNDEELEVVRRTMEDIIREIKIP
jgi:hypothetical protein